LNTISTKYKKNKFNYIKKIKKNKSAAAYQKSLKIPKKLRLNFDIEGDKAVQLFSVVFLIK
jgi:hypothetical protein